MGGELRTSPAPGRLAPRLHDTPPRGGSRTAAAVDPPPGNLPAGVNGFLGRKEELSEVAGFLEGSRLITLTGPPGIGKSRLGLELARDVAGSCPDGAWLVELAAVGEAELVPGALAATLSISEVPGQSLTGAIVARLRTRRLLLVLDNCEHLVGACAELADALLCGCPGLRILATSREPLGVAGERVRHVPPLSIPAADEAPRPEVLIGYDAIALFVDRAEAVRPEFELNAEVAPAVAEICRRLDGIPLALELAAARVEILTPSEIAARLDDRFALLTGGSRSDLAHHQTLQAAVDWSYELLTVPEQLLLGRLAVFAGGFSLEAAEAVCAGGGVDAADVLDLLARLVAKSLVVSNTANSRGRYRMLETVRAYAADRLAAAGEEHDTARAHARYYVALAERAEPALVRPDQVRWFARLEGERENLRAAVEWSLAHGRSEWALRIGGALVVFWVVRCHFTEGRGLLDDALAASNGARAPVRAKALWGAGLMTLMVGEDIPAAARAAEASLAVFRELGDHEGAARALLILGNSRLYLSHPRWLATLQQSAALAREAGDSWCQALALFVAGFAYASWEDLPRARPLLEDCLAVARAANDRNTLNRALIGLGKVTVRQGDYPEAQALLEEAVDGAVELGDEYTRVTALEHLGELAVRRGEYARARELLEEAAAALPGLAPPWAHFGPAWLLGIVAHAERDRAGARAHFEEAIARAHPRTRICPAVQGLAQLEHSEGETDAARRLFEEALERARAGLPDNASAAEALHGLGELARDAGDAKRAAALHNEALQLRRQIGDAPGIVSSLEAIGGLAAAGGRHDHAARLMGAAQAHRERCGYTRPPWERARHEADVDVVRAALTHEQFDAAFAAGSALSIDEAAGQAAKGRGRRGRPASGWSSLTEIEQQVAALVAEGLTNPEIAERLFVSVSTVKAHVSRIFPKLGVTSRRELAREVWRRDGSPDPE